MRSSIFENESANLYIYLVHDVIEKFIITQNFIEFWKLIKYWYFLLYIHIIGSWLQSTNRVRIHDDEWMVNIHSIILYVPLRYRYIKCWRSDKGSWSWFLSEQKIVHTILKRNFKCRVHNERKYSFPLCIIYNFYI